MNDIKVSDLKSLARQLGMRGYCRLRKDDLIDFINDNLRSRPRPRPGPNLLQGQHQDLVLQLLNKDLEGTEDSKCSKNQNVPQL